MPSSERRMRGRPRKWTEKENRLLMELGEKYPQRGELRQHLTNIELDLPHQFPGKTIAALMMQYMRLVKRATTKVDHDSVSRVTRASGSAVQKRSGCIREGEGPGDSEPGSESDSDSGTEDRKDRDTEPEESSETDVRVVIPHSSTPAAAQLQKIQSRAMQHQATDGYSYPFTYRAESFMCKIDQPSPTSQNLSPSLTEQQGSIGLSPCPSPPVEMAEAGGLLSTARILYGNATKYHQENLMKERELLYAISEAGDNVEMGEKRVQDARSRRETLRRELEEVRERVRVGVEMDKVLQRQLHHVGG